MRRPFLGKRLIYLLTATAIVTIWQGVALSANGIPPGIIPEDQEEFEEVVQGLHRTAMNLPYEHQRNPYRGAAVQKQFDADFRTLFSTPRSFEGWVCRVGFVFPDATSVTPPGLSVSTFELARKSHAIRCSASIQYILFVDKTDKKATDLLASIPTGGLILFDGDVITSPDDAQRFINVIPIHLRLPQ